MVELKVCTPCYKKSLISKETSESINKLLDSDISSVWAILEGTIIDDLRNDLINDKQGDVLYQIINQPFTHYLFVDSDIQFEVDDVKTLLSYDFDIVSGSYPMRQVRDMVCGGFFVMNGIDDGIGGLAGNHLYECNKIVEVDWVGGGFLLVKKEVFEKVSYPWFHRFMINKIDANGVKHRKQAGEDIGFCLNAKEHGLKVMIDHTTRVNHIVA